LEEIYEETYDPEGQETFDLRQILQESDLPEWHQQELLEADQIDREYLSRYLSVPHGDSHQGYQDMEDFIATVQDERLQDRLWRAIQGRGAFRCFKDTLAYYPRERERWFEFTDNLQQQRVLDWLASEGIEPIIEPQPEDEPPDPLFSPRFLLIEEVRVFVSKASQLAGVTRIALIGSLTTNEPEPKDADLLVTITDEADLASLAKLGRKLQGHAQSFGRGGEVFLANLQGNYLGRTCPWKRCGPGIRAGCDALHCGQRLYLHDDFEDIRLGKDLIAAPPIELWPEVVTRVPVPEDIEQNLIALLRQWLL
jgi:hypothetical protein